MIFTFNYIIIIHLAFFKNKIIIFYEFIPKIIIVISGGKGNSNFSSPNKKNQIMLQKLLTY